MGCRLLCGDCLDRLPLILDGTIDLIVTDLPYGITRNRWDCTIPMIPLWEQLCRVAKPSAAILLFASGMFTADVMQSGREFWRYNLVWEKTQPTGFLNAHKMPLRAHEDICVFYRQLPTYHTQKTMGHPRKVSAATHKRNSKQSEDYGKYQPSDYDSTERFPRSVLRFAKDVQKSALHGTQKPVALLEYLIRTYSDIGETVPDCCMGSGPTGVACLHTERNFIGIEKDPKIFDCARNRIESESIYPSLTSAAP